MSPWPESPSRDWVVGAPAHDRHPIHMASPLMNSSAGGEPTWGQAHIALSGWARLGPAGSDPATRRSPAPTLGLTPEWGPGNAIQGNVNIRVFILVIGGIGYIWLTDWLIDWWNYVRVVVNEDPPGGSREITTIPDCNHTPTTPVCPTQIQQQTRGNISWS